MERFCPITNKWYNDIAPTSNCRTSVGVCCLDGALYAIGGQDGVSCLNVVEYLMFLLLSFFLFKYLNLNNGMMIRKTL